MADDDYELVSKKEIMEMKGEIEHLKKNPLGNNATSKDLLSSVDSLNHTMQDMMGIFQEAAKGMVEEEHSVDNKQFSELSEKIDSLIEQNKKIAKGIVTVADLLSKHQDEPKPAEKPKEQSPFGMPDFDSPLGPPSGPPSNGPHELPPLPGGPPPSMGLPPSGPPGSSPPPPGLGPMPPPPSMPEPEKKGFFHKKR